MKLKKCLDKISKDDYSKEEYIKKENGQSIDDIYLKLEL